MELVNNLRQQLAQIYDTVDIVCAVGIVYFVLRGRRHFRGAGRAVLLPAVVPLCYVLVLAGMSLRHGTAVAERYYRPILPFLVVFSALGLYCLGQDVKRKRALHVVVALVLLGCLVVTLRGPIRAHRRAQTEAGRWLRARDPGYHGFVLADYTQPVYYARMELLPAYRGEGVLGDCLRHGEPVKYAILDKGHGPGHEWAQKYIEEHQWRLIYRGEERDVRIYLNSEFDREDPAGAGQG